MTIQCVMAMRHWELPGCAVIALLAACVGTRASAPLNHADSRPAASSASSATEAEVDRAKARAEILALEREQTPPAIDIPTDASSELRSKLNDLKLAVEQMRGDILAVPLAFGHVCNITDPSQMAAVKGAGRRAVGIRTRIDGLQGNSGLDGAQLITYTRVVRKQQDFLRARLQRVEAEEDIQW